MKSTEKDVIGSIAPALLLISAVQDESLVLFLSSYLWNLSH